MGGGKALAMSPVLGHPTWGFTQVRADQRWKNQKPRALGWLLLSPSDELLIAWSDKPVCIRKEVLIRHVFAQPFAAGAPLVPPQCGFCWLGVAELYREGIRTA